MTSESFFNEIESHYNNRLPFVVYKKGSINRISALLQEDNKSYALNDYSESGFVMAPFDTLKTPIFIPKIRSKKIETTDVGLSLLNDQKTIPSEDVVSKYSHLNLVDKAINAIKKSHLEKIVISRKETIAVSNDPLELFKRLLSSYPEAFVYCWCHPETGLWLGATPETLLNIENNSFSTMSLAGTKLYNGNLDVNWSEKEIKEQRIVTDFIVNQLEGEIENIQQSKVETVKAGNLVHLRTNISGILNDKKSNLKTIVNKLHPTPAVCGFPREFAKDFILKNENYNRAFYTGYLGELNMKKNYSRNTNRRNVENSAYKSVKTVTNLFVNLRCMQLNANQVHIYVGGGITIDSNPEKEWQETIAKSNTIKKVL